MRDINTTGRQNGFGAILNSTGTIIFIFGIMMVISTANSDPDTIVEFLQIPLTVSFAFTIMLVGLGIKIPGKIITILADIEYNTRSYRGRDSNE